MIKKTSCVLLVFSVCATFAATPQWTADECKRIANALCSAEAFPPKALIKGSKRQPAIVFPHKIMQEKNEYKKRDRCVSFLLKQKKGLFDESIFHNPSCNIVSTVAYLLQHVLGDTDQIKTALEKRTGSKQDPIFAYFWGIISEPGAPEKQEYLERFLKHYNSFSKGIQELLGVSSCGNAHIHLAGFFALNGAIENAISHFHGVNEVYGVTQGTADSLSQCYRMINDQVQAKKWEERALISSNPKGAVTTKLDYLFQPDPKEVKNLRLEFNRLLHDFEGLPEKEKNRFFAVAFHLTSLLEGAKEKKQVLEKINIKLQNTHFFTNEIICQLHNCIEKSPQLKNSSEVTQLLQTLVKNAAYCHDSSFKKAMKWLSPCVNSDKEIIVDLRDGPLDFLQTNADILRSFKILKGSPFTSEVADYLDCERIIIHLSMSILFIYDISKGGLREAFGEITQVLPHCDLIQEYRSGDVTENTLRAFKNLGFNPGDIIYDNIQERLERKGSEKSAEKYAQWVQEHNASFLKQLSTSGGTLLGSKRKGPAAYKSGNGAPPPAATVAPGFDSSTTFTEAKRAAKENAYTLPEDMNLELEVETASGGSGSIQILYELTSSRTELARYRPHVHYDFSEQESKAILWQHYLLKKKFDEGE